MNGKVLVAALLLGTWVIQVGAGDDDHDQARRLRENGEVLPLAQVIGMLREHQPGRVLEAELEQKHGRWVYEIELLDPDGAVWEFYMDASSGELLEWERED